ncbi:hypothetical protein [Variovorax paradoxus]|uniref:Putative phage associated protein n=1 Tax=Variovorax paradoxus (strain EPS) TaxID=595537 RepID=E6V9T5_VARPE|nr:hypothetical protein [Variovorax paradoxus]ADU36223.1 putative phage associated protein [Variovorax paradoxus EPS]
MPTNTNGVPVKYIGREDPFYDRLYGSNLPFEPGQVRVITDLDLVAKFLRHDDCFERVVLEPVVPAAAPVLAPAPTQSPVAPTGEGSSSETGATSLTSAAPTGEAAQGKDESTQVPEDDTEARLAAAKKLEDEQKLLEQNRLDLVQTLDSMDKDALQNFARDKFQQTVPKTLSLDNMRAKVVGLIDQFGVQ